MKVNLYEPSTKRGLVCVVTGLVAVVFWWFGKDVQPVLAAGTFVVGGLGVALPDRSE